jgi:GNAT superfamily N-acetyltransferase
MTTSSDAFAIYLRCLIASWEGLATVRSGARVVHGAGYIAARFPEPYLNNAVVLTPEAVEPAAQTYAAGDAYALWCLDDEQQIAAALANRGYVHSETTRPMLRNLDHLPDLNGTEVAEAELERFAALIEVPTYLLRGVPDLWAYADAAYDSGLVLQRADEDVYVSMVFTRPQARGRGLATAVLTAALRDARGRGARRAVLQATPMAERMYRRQGFEAVGRWQEWVLGETHC